jgi:hypothetical protein
MKYLLIAQAVAFGLSAIFWFLAGITPTPLPMAYPSGPPAHVVRRIKWQSWLNTAAAITAGIGTALAAYTSWPNSN